MSSGHDRQLGRKRSRSQPNGGEIKVGDFRDEEFADKYEGFLVVASSKSDTLSLVEPNG
jgi:hypothetical protein